MKTILLLTLSLISYTLSAQLTGQVDYKPLGISFTVPDGWLGNENEAGFMMGHNTIPGFVMMMPSEIQSFEELKSYANESLDEGNGTFLSPTGKIETITSNIIGREFSGTLEWTPAKAYVVGVYNKIGYSVSIIAITSKAAYNETYRDLAVETAKSIKLYQAEIPQIVLDWKQRLEGKKLTSMSSSSSSSGSTIYDSDGNASTYNEGTYSSSKTSFGLCPSGYFYYYSRHSASFDTSSASSHVSNGEHNDGTWDVISDAFGNPFLVLTFKNGNVWEYQLERDKDGKTFLNGSRYYKTVGEDGPDCN